MLFATNTGSFTSAGAVDDPDPDGHPGDFTLPHGTFAFEIDDVPVGGDATISVVVVDGDPIEGDTYFKFGAQEQGAEEAWFEFTPDEDTGTGATSEVIDLSDLGLGFTRSWTLTIQDGGRGDDGFAPDGRIRDPGGPAVRGQVDPTSPTTTVPVAPTTPTTAPVAPITPTPTTTPVDPTTPTTTPVTGTTPNATPAPGAPVASTTPASAPVASVASITTSAAAPTAQAQSAGQELPRTGMEVYRQLWLAALLLGSGAVALFGTRRRARLAAREHVRWSDEVATRDRSGEAHGVSAGSL